MWLTALSILAEFPMATVEEFIHVHRVKDDTRDNFLTSASRFPTIKSEINVKSFACLMEAS